jgi:hypothetical protein
MQVPFESENCGVFYEAVAAEGDVEISDMVAVNGRRCDFGTT